MCIYVCVGSYLDKYIRAVTPPPNKKSWLCPWLLEGKKVVSLVSLN